MRKPRDSGSSGNDRDRSSGSKKSGGERMVRKPSKELLKIQNFSDSTDEEDLKLPSRRSGSKHRHSHLSDMKSSQDQVDSQETGNDDQCGLSSTSKEYSPNTRSKIKKSPIYSQKSPRTSKKYRKSPEQAHSTNSSSHTCKSLNTQIKEYIKSPSKSRKLSTFDAFNHTSSLKLSHVHSSQEKSKYDNQSKYDSFYDYYHPRRSSREVLDFTSSRKSNKDLTALDDENQTLHSKRHSLKGDNSGQEENENGDSLREDLSHLTPFYNNLLSLRLNLKIKNLTNSLLKTFNNFYKF